VISNIVHSNKFNFSGKAIFSARVNRLCTSSRIAEGVLERFSKNLPEQKLGPLFKNARITFHGIGNDVSKLDSILRNGILSKNEGLDRGVHFSATHGCKNFNGYNGPYHISLCRSPIHSESKGFNSGAFDRFARKGLTFIVSPNEIIPMQKGTEMDSRIAGECFAYGQIPISNILGILLPENFQECSLSDINFLADGSKRTMHLRCQDLYKYVSTETGLVDENLWELIQNEPLAYGYTNKKYYEIRINDFVVKAYRLMGINNYKDLILSIISNLNIKLYDHLGNEVSSSDLNLGTRKELKIKRQELRDAFHSANKDPGQIEANDEWEGTLTDGVD